MMKIRVMKEDGTAVTMSNVVSVEVVERKITKEDPRQMKFNFGNNAESYKTSDDSDPLETIVYRMIMGKRVK